jgi:sulfite reductase beta subunit-like hemoprotein
MPEINDIAFVPARFKHVIGFNVVVGGSFSESSGSRDSDECAGC